MLTQHDTENESLLLKFPTGVFTGLSPVSLIAFPDCPGIKVLFGGDVAAVFKSVADALDVLASADSSVLELNF